MLRDTAKDEKVKEDINHILILNLTGWPPEAK
jgi:hypothetical protein